MTKVFRRTSHTHGPVVDWDDHDFLTRRLYATECAAYKRLQSHPEIAVHLPEYFGPINESTLSLPPSTSGQPYVAGCAFRLERLSGTDIKMAFVPQPTQQQAEAVLEAIRDLCPRINVWDASCFIPGPRSGFALIDFAYWEDLSDLQVYLDEHKHIPAALRARLAVIP